MLVFYSAMHGKFMTGIVRQGQVPIVEQLEPVDIGKVDQVTLLGGTMSHREWETAKEKLAQAGFVEYSVQDAWDDRWTQSVWVRK